MKKIIELKNITKAFDGEPVLQNVNLDIYDNEFITLLGPSGCGKTTMLRLIGGFETPDEGEVLFLGKKINDVPPYKRNVNTVFQKYALFPHLNVFENVAFPLREKKVPKGEIEAKVHEMLSLVALSGFENRAVTRLSGGQQQRVAIARALVARDQEEALSMSDTVVVMSEGKIHQIGTPIDIYNEPQNAFVADFIGESNILDGTMLEDYKVSFSGQTFPCLDKDFGRNVPVDVVVRPEDVDIVPLEQGQLTGVVTSVTFMGVHYEIIVDVGGFKWMVQTTDFVDVDEHIGIVLEPDAIHIMKKSEYSNRYGDYSSFSNELEELSEITEEEAE